MKAYAYAGTRVPFNPDVVSDGCLLCGRKKIVMVGVFVPTTDAMRAVVQRLSTNALPGQSCIGYRLCRRHAVDLDGIGDRVEAALCSAAERVVAQ